MKRFAIIFNDTVIDAIVWDGKTEWHYPFDHDKVIESNDLQIGMIKENGAWVMPERIIEIEEDEQID